MPAEFAFSLWRSTKKRATHAKVKLLGKCCIPQGRAKAPHAPPITLATDPPDSINPTTKTASIALPDSSPVAGENVQRRS
jgi:hypothetical protein